MRARKIRAAGAPQHRNRVRSIALRTVLMSALWWVLTGGAAATWGLGVASVASAVAASLVLLPPRARSFSLSGLPGFLAFFLLQSVKAGVQVAAMALRPRPDLRPAVLEIRLQLPDQGARILLACTMTLLPGTLSFGLDGDRLLLHVLDRRMPNEQELRKAEARIARLFRIVL
ncbi:MAG: Na+/H+ antiporter subunit E [Oxalobacteraceae bacterium]|nr:Na+/H+ antiporter subunit E [Oxalobacteraceae bacterium]